MPATTVVNMRYASYDVRINRRSKWGNPFHIGKDDNRGRVIERYRVYILSSPELLDSLWELQGKVLGCWCKPLACHGDVLVGLIRAREIAGEL